MADGNELEDDSWMNENTNSPSMLDPNLPDSVTKEADDSDEKSAVGIGAGGPSASSSVISSAAAATPSDNVGLVNGPNSVVSSSNDPSVTPEAAPKLLTFLLQTTPDGQIVGVKQEPADPTSPPPAANSSSSSPQSAGAAASSSSPQQVAPATVKQEPTAAPAAPCGRPLCQYEGSCYRRSGAHKAQFAHPGDSDWLDGPNRPLCPFDPNCYRRSKAHRVNARHTCEPVRRTPPRPRGAPPPLTPPTSPSDAESFNSEEEEEEDPYHTDGDEDDDYRPPEE